MGGRPTLPLEIAGGPLPEATVPSQWAGLELITSPKLGCPRSLAKRNEGANGSCDSEKDKSVHAVNWFEIHDASRVFRV